jgi:hypothetical protein
MPSLVVDLKSKEVISRWAHADSAQTDVLERQAKGTLAGQLFVFTVPSCGDSFNPLLPFDKIAADICGELKLRYPKLEFIPLFNAFQLEISIGWSDKNLDYALRTDKNGSIWSLLPSKTLYAAREDAQQMIESYMANESDPFHHLNYPEPRIGAYYNPAAVKIGFQKMKKDPNAYGTTEPVRTSPLATWPADPTGQTKLEEKED